MRLFVSCCFKSSLFIFNLWHFNFFDILIIMCFGVDLIGFILFGTLCVYWTWMSFAVLSLEKFSAIISLFFFKFLYFLIISLNKLFAPFSLFFFWGCPNEKNFKNEDRLRDILDNIRWTFTLKGPQKKKREKGAKSLFKEIIKK